MIATVQISPILVLAFAALVGGGRGGVREARAGLSGATAQKVERRGSIRA
jgi:hypothetical protein